MKNEKLEITSESIIPLLNVLRNNNSTSEYEETTENKNSDSKQNFEIESAKE